MHSKNIVSHVVITNNRTAKLWQTADENIQKHLPSVKRFLKLIGGSQPAGAFPVVPSNASVCRERMHGDVMTPSPERTTSYRYHNYCHKLS